MQQPAYQSSWIESLAEYGIWLYYTGNRSKPILYFPEGVFYPQISQYRYEIFDFSSAVDIYANVISNSVKYIKLENVDENISLNLKLSADSNVESGFNLLSSEAASALILRNDILQNFQINEDSLIIAITNASEMDANFIIDNIAPEKFTLNQNYPNPFNNKTQILVELVNNTKFSLIIYNEIGEKIKTLQKENTKPAGFYFYEWNGENDLGKLVSSGVYFAAFESNQKSKVVKLIYIK